MTALAKLLPCPFCGYDMSADEDGAYQKAGFIGAQTPVWAVTCAGTDCNASVETTSSERSVAAWNRRAALSPAELGGVEVDEAERRSRDQRAMGWDAVCDVLFELRPKWTYGAGTGIELAVATIREGLSTPQPAQAGASGGMTFAFMAEVCDAAVQAMQANGLIKRTIRLQEVRDQLRQFAAAPQPQEAPAQERDDSGPYEFGAGIPDNPKAKYWQDRAYFWRSHAIALGYVAGDGTQRCPPAHGDGEGDSIDEIVDYLDAVIRGEYGSMALHNSIKRTRDRLSALTTRPTPEARNAERYRWLRENADIEDVFYGDRVKLSIPAPDIDGFNDLNDVIDAALALPAQGEGSHETR